MKTLLEQIREIDQRIWAKTAIMKTFREHLADMGKYPYQHPDDDKTDTEEQIETPKILDTDAKTATEEQIEKAKERLNNKRDVENFLMDFKHGNS
jgi:hypothetical protein